MCGGCYAMLIASKRGQQSPPNSRRHRRLPLPPPAWFTPHPRIRPATPCYLHYKITTCALRSLSSPPLGPARSTPPPSKPVSPRLHPLLARLRASPRLGPRADAVESAANRCSRRLDASRASRGVLPSRWVPAARAFLTSRPRALTRALSLVLVDEPDSDFATFRVALLP